MAQGPSGHLPRASRCAEECPDTASISRGNWRPSFSGQANHRPAATGSGTGTHCTRSKPIARRSAARAANPGGTAERQAFQAPGNIPPKTTTIPVAAGPEPFIKGFTDFILESNPHGRLGNPLTREANEILLKACRQAAADKYWMFEHIGGASEPEQFLRDLDSKTTKGGSFPDLSFDATLQNGQIVRVLLNTVTMLKDGKTPTKNEQRRLTNLERNAGNHAKATQGRTVVNKYPKMVLADPENKDAVDKYRESYAKDAKNFCSEVLDTLELEMRDELMKHQAAP